MSEFNPHKVDTSVAEAFGEYCEVVSKENYDALLRLYEQACKDRDMHAARVEVNVEYLNARTVRDEH